jgi:hypothetical protein
MRSSLERAPLARRPPFDWPPPVGMWSSLSNIIFHVIRSAANASPPEVGPVSAVAQDSKHFERIQRAYAAEWRRQFASRLRIAQLYAHIAMSPTLGPATEQILARLPQALTFAARMAGKARPAAVRRSLN